MDKAQFSRDDKSKKGRLSSVLNGRISKDKPRRIKNVEGIVREVATSFQENPPNLSFQYMCHANNNASGRLSRCEMCNHWYRG
ncbi:unnamed protein product [Bursaphelenchus okinawaensis]|uniref:Uncharacterized protein n=1 Tax=Bursaphelenchus okinawaensis TaxID=465554 RepID=A0A811JS85_9BILA|nr:unnamed protein product [Bursaphelenchus okinawaensis]CAG9080212.1 unnamed protein product [Bursaphelenchus okinawaensis]